MVAPGKILPSQDKEDGPLYLAHYLFPSHAHARVSLSAKSVQVQVQEHDKDNEPLNAAAVR